MSLYIGKLSELEENIEYLRESYKLYKIYKEKADKEQETIDHFKSLENSQYLINILNNFYTECYNKGIDIINNASAQRFLSENKELIEFCDAHEEISYWLSKMSEVSNFFFDDYAELVLLVNDNKKYILDLKECEIVDINKFDEDFADFIIRSLKEHNNMYEIKPEDLPLLMAIKHDMCYNPHLNDVEKGSRAAEKFYILSEIPYLIYLEYIRAKMIEENVSEKDEIRAHIPFIYDNDIQEKMWNTFENQKLSEDDFWKEYYKLLIIFGTNVEELYKSTPVDRKKYVIDAYHYFSSLADHNEHFRVTSPLINEEVLKRKYLTKNKKNNNKII